MSLVTPAEPQKRRGLFLFFFSSIYSFTILTLTPFSIALTFVRMVRKLCKSKNPYTFFLDHPPPASRFLLADLPLDVVCLCAAVIHTTTDVVAIHFKTEGRAAGARHCWLAAFFGCVSSFSHHPLIFSRCVSQPLTKLIYRISPSLHDLPMAASECEPGVPKHDNASSSTAASSLAISTGIRASGSMKKVAYSSDEEGEDQDVPCASLPLVNLPKVSFPSG